MGCNWGLKVAMVIVIAAPLSGCGKPKNVNLVGTWKYVSDARGGATLVLRRDGKYNFCIAGHSCESGQYSVVVASSSDDDNGDRINFSGDAMAEFEGNYAQTEDAGGNPMKVISGHITYGLFGKPWIRTNVIDSPDHYEKISDQIS